MGHCLSDNGEFEKALPWLEKALGINVMANAQWGIVAIKTMIPSAFSKQERAFSNSQFSDNEPPMKLFAKITVMGTFTSSPIFSAFS